MARWQPRTPKESLEASLDRVKKQDRNEEAGNQRIGGPAQAGRAGHQGAIVVDTRRHPTTSIVVGCLLSPHFASLTRDATCGGYTFSGGDKFLWRTNRSDKRYLHQ